MIMTLEKKVVTLSPNIGNDIRNTIQNAYYIYSLTNSKTGLVELAVILGETEKGWLSQILHNSFANSLSQFFDLINHLQDTVAGVFVDKLHRFRKIRNKVKSSSPITNDEFEDAFNIFLEFAEWFYEKYHNMKSIYDDTYYRRELGKNEYIAERFKVLKCLGKHETHNTYLVKDNNSSRDKVFLAKVPFVLNARYNAFVQNEKRNHVLVQEHPNIGRLYSSYPIKPVGEVLIYEYIEGRNLEEWMHVHYDDDKMLVDFLYIMGIVLSGLEHIHKRNFVHGFIKPSNIIITPSDGVKITGFEYCSAVGTAFDFYELFIQKNDAYKDPKLKERHKNIDTYAMGMVMHEILKDKSIPDIVKGFIERACNCDPLLRYSNATVMKEYWGHIFKHIRYDSQIVLTPPKKVGLISCSRRKKEYSCLARELYSESERFVQALHYVEDPKNGYDKNFIVSGRHGLVELDSFLSPYDCDLREFPLSVQAAWARFIVQLLIREGIDENTLVIVHADDLYKTLLISALLERDIPVEEGIY